MRMKKYDYYNLSIEVTRRCNMACPHCIRGDARQIDINTMYIAKFLQHVNHIGNLTFTGGEPSLNVDAMKETLNLCRKYDIPVDSFYVVTNGKQVTKEFIHVLMDWTLYCLECNPTTIEDGLSGVTVSEDVFHEKIDQKNLNMLKTLSVYRDGDKRIDWNKASLINLGRAKEIRNYNKREPFDPCIDVNYGCVDGNILLAANGLILPDCDYAYEDESELTIGNVSSAEGLETYYTFLEERERECA